MATLAMIIMTPEENEAATLLNSPTESVEGRLIDNPLANNLGHGTLVGKYVVAARLLNDPVYERWVPTLGQLPIRVMDIETVVLPALES